MAKITIPSASLAKQSSDEANSKPFDLLTEDILHYCETKIILAIRMGDYSTAFEARNAREVENLVAGLKQLGYKVKNEGLTIYISWK